MKYPALLLGGMGSFPSEMDGLSQKLSNRPNVIVRFSDISGRSDEIAGPEVPAAIRSFHGVVFVELRDGTYHATGKLLLP